VEYLLSEQLSISVKTSKTIKNNKFWKIQLISGIAQSIERLTAGRTTEGSEFEPRCGQEFFYSTQSRLALGSIQPPIQWIPRDLSSVIKRPRREADHSHPACAKVNKIWVYTSTPPYAFMDHTLHLIIFTICYRVRWEHLLNQPLIGLLYKIPMIYYCGAVCEMRIGRGNQTTWRKPAPAPLCPPQILYDLSWDRTKSCRSGKPATKISWIISEHSLLKFTFASSQQYSLKVELGVSRDRIWVRNKRTVPLTGIVNTASRITHHTNRKHP
jgi:hypothetical protein